VRSLAQARVLVGGQGFICRGTKWLRHSHCHSISKKHTVAWPLRCVLIRILSGAAYRDREKEYYFKWPLFDRHRRAWQRRARERREQAVSSGAFRLAQTMGNHAGYGSATAPSERVVAGDGVRVKSRLT
jgi:hypothetical protein